MPSVSRDLGECRLFERLDAASRLEDSVEGAPALIESIKRHLTDLLNSYPGHSPCVPDLGLADFNDATVAALDLKLGVRQAVQACIERFEPRVTDVDVEVQDQGSGSARLRFRVRARLASDSRRDETTLDLLLADRRYRFVE